jgi:ABC-type polysaccharide/polyol phosphate transport system ATPase subunit
MKALTTDHKYAIRMKDLSICFYVRESGHVSLKEFLFSPAKYKLLQKRFVLQHISMDIEVGDSVGLLGRNGSGKSTLLRVMSGIIEPESGSLQVNGKVAPLLGLGVGLEQELSGRENIHLSCALMGMSKAETKSLMHEIISFSELGEQIDWPVKRYSTGMMSRLSFSIAIMNNPDILLIDEVLSVGDKGFQQKCLQKVSELKALGTTIVFVSHSFDEVKKICNKAAFINNGRLELYGDVETVGAKYAALFND